MRNVYTYVSCEDVRERMYVRAYVCVLRSSARVIVFITRIYWFGHLFVLTF